MLKSKNIPFVFLFILVLATGCQQQPQGKQGVAEGKEETEAPEGNSEQRDTGPSRISIADIEDSELESFTEIQEEVRQVNQLAQDSIMTALEKANLDVQRFQEIRAVAQDPTTNTDVSRAELENFKVVYAEIEAIRSHADQRLDSLLGEEDISRERYAEISDALKMSPELRQRASQLQENEGN